MTAYGRGEYQQGDTLLVSEIRSLNNRYRDIILRIPKNLQPLESELRAIISSRVRRGRIELSIQMEYAGEGSPHELELNMPLVDSYFRVFDQLSERFGLDQEIRLESLWDIKDVVLVRSKEVDIEEARHGLTEVLDQALDSLDKMKISEGRAIEADFVGRLDLLERYLHEVGERAPILVETYRKRLKDNIHRMLEDKVVDENRLAQEVALFAERSDITEEIVRIKSHLGQFRKYMSLDDALGRRLDFLLQEINREVNTLGAKGSDSSISSIVVEMKAELEKLREQVQNVE